MIRRFGQWFDDRTGVPTAVRGFFDERTPASAGWAQVFGSVALFLLLTQAFTGVLLAINYAPAPGEAYRSLNYIVGQVTGGRMIRGLHHWGASMMIVVVVLHMLQVFIYGAYKKPREVTWMAGVPLLLLTLVFGLTGYLLPWDNRAYWGTIVTTQIAGQAPFIGAYLQRLLGTDSGGVGALTFSRFYSLHTLILPGLAFALVIFHVYLVRRHGVTPATPETPPGERFFPAQAFRDTCAVFAAFVILFLLAAMAQAPLEHMADPTDTAYIPRPDWYFLFLFQMLKLFQGAAEPIGSMVLPGLAVAVLFFMPFLDRTAARRAAKRTGAMALALIAVLGWTGLTAAAVMTTPHSVQSEKPTAAWASVPPAELAGLGHLRTANCTSCHNVAGGQPKPGPDLAGLAGVAFDGSTVDHITTKSKLNPDQAGAIISLVRRLNPENAEAISDAPAGAVAGAQVFAQNGCAQCHTANGVGGAIGPVLNGVGRRRTRDWIAQHLRNPQSQTPGSIMPSFERLSAQDRDALISYLLSLPGS